MISISVMDSNSRQSSVGVQLGGVTVYGQTRQQTIQAIQEIGQTIDDQGKSHLSITRPVLQKLVSDKIGERIERRLFGAILGSRVRFGQFEALLCEAEEGAEFRVFIHTDQIRRFRTALRDTQIILERSDEVIVKEIEDTLFPARAYNTWSSTSHVLARLVFEGKAEYVDKMTFRFPKGLDDAVSDTKQ